MGLLRNAVDAALELPVAPSFTRLGYDARARYDHWRPLDSYDLTGQVVLLTVGTSGLGRAAARQLATCGAAVTLLGRDLGRTRAAWEDIARATGNEQGGVLLADMADLAQVRAAAAEFAEDHDRLDVLVHNAGALTSDRRTAPDGTEATVAAQVLGPFLLTSLLLPCLRSARPGRVLTMSSGGMYGAPVTVDRLQMGPDYNGTEQYARAKRAQVVLNEMWADRVDPTEVVFHSLHPGWADTPGVRASLPTFRKVVGPLLRTPVQGADTLVWLAADDEPLGSTGGFWHDRQVRTTHRLPSTRRSDTPELRQRLWDWCAQRTGADVPSTSAP
ncbi:MAG: SDR family NAD(P)-dependent oxidoreductase [Actinomycetes bacterium]